MENTKCLQEDERCKMQNAKAAIVLTTFVSGMLLAGDMMWVASEYGIMAVLHSFAVGVILILQAIIIHNIIEQERKE